MKKLQNFSIYALLAALAFFVLFTLLKMRPSPSSDVAYKIVKKEVHDTIYMPVPTPAEVVYVPVPEEVDTDAILQDYYSQYIYIDTLHASNFVDIRIVDTIGTNKLLAHSFEVLSLPELYVPPSANSTYSLALGALAGIDVAILKADFSVQRHTMSLGYDFRNKTPIVGYSFKIFTCK